MNINLPKGTYILVLKLSSARSIRVGKLGEFEFPPGYNLYVGSAFGPGGLGARLKHHLSISSRPHWHIDYLRREAVVEQVWYSEEQIPREHQWADRLQTTPGATIPAPGFGASDCTCRSHLFHFIRLPSIKLVEGAKRLLLSGKPEKKSEIL